MECGCALFGALGRLKMGKEGPGSSLELGSSSGRGVNKKEGTLKSWPTSDKEDD